MIRVGCVGMWLAGALAVPAFLVGQVEDPDPPTFADSATVRAELGFNLVGAQPVGEFADYVDLGGGFGLIGVWNLGDSRAFGLRLDFGLIIYGSNTVSVPLSPTIPFVEVDVTTENAIGSLSFGPQFVLGRGPIRPYLHGGVGVSQFVTTTSVRSSGTTEPFASTQNHEDHVSLLTFGGGLRAVLSGSRKHPLSFELGGQYVRRGLADYLREGGAQAGPGGEVVLETIRSETSLFTFHLGMTVGFR